MAGNTSWRIGYKYNILEGNTWLVSAIKSRPLCRFAPRAHIPGPELSCIRMPGGYFAGKTAYNGCGKLNMLVSSGGCSRHLWACGRIHRLSVFTKQAQRISEGNMWSAAAAKACRSAPRAHIPRTKLSCSQVPGCQTWGRLYIGWNGYAHMSLIGEVPAVLT